MKAESLTLVYYSQTEFQMYKLRMSWFLVFLILSLTFSGFSEGSHGKKLPPTVVIGTVYCDTCSLQDFSKTSHFIAGASVGVECKDGNSKPGLWKEVVRTNEHGEFKVELPFSVRKHVRRIEGCTVKLIKSSEAHCSVASAATSSSLSLKSRNQREHTFSAGLFSFKPLQQPHLCNHKPSSVQNSEDFDSVKTLLPPNLDPTIPIGLVPLPPLPEVPPLPPLPKLPPLPDVPVLPPVVGIPLPPLPANAHDSKKAQFSDRKAIFPPLFPPLIPPLVPNPFQPPPLIPNPFQPPPLIPIPFQPPAPPLIPNPFQPPSPPPLIPNPFQPPSPPPLIPNPFQPPPSPPSPLFPFPPIPGLTPSPPPPPPPFLPFPFPPLFPPRSPGNPPASSASKITSP